MRIKKFWIGGLMFISATVYGQRQDALHGNLMTPTKVFFDQTGSKAITISLADVVLWDVPAGKPLNRIDLANNIREYNPFTSTFNLGGFATRDLTKVIVELSTAEARFGFVLDMRTGKLHADDNYFNDKATGFDSNGDYFVFRNLRTNNGPIGTTLEIGLAGATTTTAVLKEFKPTGMSYDGRVVYGHDLKSNKLVIYDVASSNVKKTKLKFDPKKAYTYYSMNPQVYCGKWIYVPGEWTKFYNTDLEEVLYEIDGLKGPYGFSDNGTHAIYYREGTPYEFVVRDLSSKQNYTAAWTSDLMAYLYNSRFIESSFQLYQLEGKEDRQEGRIVVYDMRSGQEVKSFSVMADPTVIELNKAGRENLLATNQSSQTNQQTQTNPPTQSANSESDANRGYESFEGLLINYDQLPMPWTLNYNTIRGRDVSNYKYKDKISYGHLEGSSLNAIGKLFSQDGNVGLLSMYRRVQGSLDYSWFKVSVFDNHGNHIQTENIGITQRDASGLSFKVDFSVEDAGDKILIHVHQKKEVGSEQKTMVVDKYTGTIK